MHNRRCARFEREPPRPHVAKARSLGFTMPLECILLVSRAQFACSIIAPIRIGPRKGQCSMGIEREVRNSLGKNALAAANPSVGSQSEEEDV